MRAAGLLKTATAEPTADAAVVVVDAAMAVAKGVATAGERRALRDESVPPSRVRCVPPWRALQRQFLPRSLLVIRNRDEASSSDRRQDTNPFCCPENRFRSTAAWHRRLPRRSALPSLPRRNQASLLLQLQQLLPDLRLR